MKTEADVAAFLEDQAYFLRALDHVTQLDLADCWISAGFIRNAVWDHLSGFAPAPQQTDDVDVLFFEPADLSRKGELEAERVLAELSPDYDWQVRNQARMHLKNGDEPYRDTEDGLRHFLETATAIGARLNGGRVEVIAPYGVDDLTTLTLRPTASGRARPHEFNERVDRKGWRQRWPKLSVIAA